jgi:hypothetical protein
MAQEVLGFFIGNAMTTKSKRHLIENESIYAADTKM